MQKSQLIMNFFINNKIVKYYNKCYPTMLIRMCMLMRSPQCTHSFAIVQILDIFPARSKSITQRGFVAGTRGNKRTSILLCQLAANLGKFK